LIKYYDKISKKFFTSNNLVKIRIKMCKNNMIRYSFLFDKKSLYTCCTMICIDE